MERLLMGRGDTKKEGEHSVGKERDAVSLGISSSWGVANVITVTFNYILLKASLFPLNVDVSPCFHGTVLAPVCRVNTSCIPNAVVSSCYRLHTACILQVLLLFQSKHVVLIYS